jgi:hypothetical protein
MVSPTRTLRAFYVAVALAASACRDAGEPARHPRVDSSAARPVRAAMRPAPRPPFLPPPLPAAVAELGRHGEDLYDEIVAAHWRTARILMDSLDAAARALPAESRTYNEGDQLGAVRDRLRVAVREERTDDALETANRVTYLAAKISVPYALAIPSEVPLLRYYGRELQIWSARERLPRLTLAATDLRHTWAALAPDVERRGGGAVARRADRLMARVAAASMPEEYGRLAAAVLDLADDVEGVFGKK